MRYVILTTLVFFFSSGPTSANARDWTVYRHETFDSYSGPLTHLDTLGNGGWLTAEIWNPQYASITMGDGKAHFDTLTDFRGACMIRTTDALPVEYKIRVKVGEVDFSIFNENGELNGEGRSGYTWEDWTNPAFEEYTTITNRSGHWLENGFYWGVVTDGITPDGQSQNQWWHNHRKAGMDACEHCYNENSQTITPFYMVYSRKEGYVRPVYGTSYEPDGSLKNDYLGSWDPVAREWDDSIWSWVIGHTFSETAYYWAEFEKTGTEVIMRLYEADGTTLITESIDGATGLGLDQYEVFHMGADHPAHEGSGETAEEYYYFGDPDTDCNEGSAYVDEIYVYVPVPLSEPATIVLLVSGLAGLLGVRRKTEA